MTTFTFLPALLRGLGVTMLVAVASIFGCALVSLLLGVARCAKGKAAQRLSGVTVELLRGASALIYLFWVFYALPLIPWAPQLDPTAASVLVLSLVGGAYGAEIVRAGIMAIPRGQHEAGTALGLSPYRIMAKIVLPQSLSQIVPAFGSLAVDLVKWTSIVSFVGVQDVLYVANTVRTVTYETVTVYAVVGLAYWAGCLAVGFVFQAIERSLPLARAMRAAGAAKSAIPGRIAEVAL